MDRRSYTKESVPTMFARLTQDDLVIEASYVAGMKSEQGAILADPAYFLTIRGDCLNIEFQLNPRQGLMLGDLILLALAHAKEKGTATERLAFHDYDLEEDE